jgi:NAD-dependent SIR2 family protein deacetylase
MHCSAEKEPCSRELMRCPEPGKIPLCKQCHSPMKPHTMFFDESYSEHYYRKESVWDFVVKADCLLVVGTSLETQFPERIVTHCLKRGVPVIEICLESCIRVGNNIQVK